MRRRDFIILLGSVAASWPLVGRAQQAGNIPKVAVLWRAGSAEQEGSNFKSLVKGFNDLGYGEGRIMLEHRFSNEAPDRFKSLAAELVSWSADVLIGVGDSAAIYLKEASATTPLIFVLVADPLGSKLVDNLAQPAGNATGLSSLGAELFSKRMALLKEMIPSLAKVGFLFNANDQNLRPYMEGTQAASTQLGLTLQTFEWHSVNDIGPAFDAMKRSGVQAFTTNPDGMAFAHRALIGQIALARNLPLLVWSREALKGGAMMSYAAEQDTICQHAAVFVDKILKGAKPAELPVEQPTKFEFLINPRAAKALGLTIPEAVLKRADATVE